MDESATATTAANCLEKLKTYARTQKGFLLAAEVIISFVIIICYAASNTGSYSTVPICEMIFAMVFFGIFMMELDKQFQLINWPWSDLFRAGLGAILYLITSLINVIGGDGARITGGAFGLIAAVLFGYDTYTIVLQVRSTRQHTAAPTDERV